MSWLDCVPPSRGLTGEMGLHNSTFYWNQLPNSRKILLHVEAHVCVCLSTCSCPSLIVFVLLPHSRHQDFMTIRNILKRMFAEPHAKVSVVCVSIHMRLCCCVLSIVWLDVMITLYV